MTEMNLDNVSFLKRSKDLCVLVDVDGDEVKMYPTRLPMVAETSKLFDRLLPALREMQETYAVESGTRHTKEVSADGSVREEAVMLPTEVGLSQTHKNYRNQLMQTLAGLYTDENSLLTMIMCIMDSCRDDFEAPEYPKTFTKSDARKVMPMMTLPVLCVMLEGLFTANLQSFPPAMRHMLEKMLSGSGFSPVSQVPKTEQTSNDSEPSEQPETEPQPTLDPVAPVVPAPSPVTPPMPPTPPGAAV